MQERMNEYAALYLPHHDSCVLCDQEDYSSANAYIERIKTTEHE